MTGHGSSTSAAPHGRVRGVAWTLLAAGVIAAAILTLMNAPGRPGPMPEFAFRDASGQPFQPIDLIGRPWIAVLGSTFATGEASPELDETTADLASILPSGIRVVRFVDEGAPRLAPHPGVLEVRGDRTTLNRFRDHIVKHSADGDTDVSAPLVASIDHTGRVRGVRAFDLAALDPVARESSALRALSRRPALHATLNGASGVLLILGFLFIRKRKIAPHLACMILAALVMGAFLFSYLQYHAIAGSVSYRGTGWVRGVYLTVLLSHTVLAALVVPMVGTVFFHAARRRFDRHRRLARLTLPIWLYVSVTGVLIYFMLYVWVPGGGHP